MLVYINMILLSTFFAYLVSKVKKTPIHKEYQNFSLQQKICIFFSMLFPILVSGLRYNVGTDYSGTYTVDYFLIKNGARTRIEFLNWCIYKISQFLSDDKQMFFLITSIIFIFFSFMAIYKLSSDYHFSILLFFLSYCFFTSMNAVRQYIAIAICYFAIDYLLKHKIMKFILCVLIATLFHKSLCIFLIAIPLSMIKITLLKIISVSAILFITSPFIESIILWGISLFNYDIYINYYNNFSMNHIFMLINIIIFISAYILKNSGNEEYDKKYNLFLNLQGVFCCLFFLQKSLPMLGRIAYIFQFGGIILISELVSHIKQKKMRILTKSIIVLLYFAYFLYGSIFQNWDDILPYTAFFNKY